MFRISTYILILFIATSLFATNWFARKKELKELPVNNLVNIIVLHEKAIEGYQNKIVRLDLKVARYSGVKLMIGFFFAALGVVALIGIVIVIIKMKFL